MSLFLTAKKKNSFSFSICKKRVRNSTVPCNYSCMQNNALPLHLELNLGLTSSPVFFIPNLLPHTTPTRQSALSIFDKKLWINVRKKKIPNLQLFSSIHFEPWEEYIFSVLEKWNLKYWDSIKNKTKQKKKHLTPSPLCPEPRPNCDPWTKVHTKPWLCVHCTYIRTICIYTCIFICTFTNVCINI